MVRRKGLVTLRCRRRRAAAEQMSTGHLHFMVRVPPEKAKTGHPGWDNPLLGVIVIMDTM